MAAVDSPLRAAVEALRDRELDWLRGLPAVQQRKLRDGGCATGRSFPAHCCTHAGEVALTLLGSKPCVLLMIGWAGSATEASFGDGLVADVLAPWLAEFGLANAFSLHKVQTSSVPPRCVCTRSPARACAAADACAATRSWLLLAEQHADAPLARATFLNGTACVSEAQRARALGYPGTIKPDACCVYYMAMDGAPYRHRDAAGVTHELPAAAAGVPLLEYIAAPHEAFAVGAHFRVAADALRQRLGIGLALNTEGCFVHDWPNEAVAACWRAAFGGQAATRAALAGGELRRFPWMSEEVIADVLACMPP
jgi:hypothetical protein